MSRRALLASVVAAVAATGCPPAPSAAGVAPVGSSAARELDVLAAASLGPALRGLLPGFEASRPGVRVALSLSSTSALERQLEEGAPCDLFIAAAAAPVDRLVAKGLLDGASRSIVARGQLVVIVPTGGAAPARLEGLSTLDRVAVGQAGVPVGDYAREALERAGLAATLEGRLAGYPDEPSVVTAVAEGGAPAGLVYASSLVTHVRRGRVARALAVPPGLHAPIVYPAALAAGAAGPRRDDARALLEHLRTGAGRAALAEAGFLPGDPDGLR